MKDKMLAAASWGLFWLSMPALYLLSLHFRVLAPVLYLLYFAAVWLALALNHLRLRLPVTGKALLLSLPATLLALLFLAIIWTLLLALLYGFGSREHLLKP